MADAISELARQGTTTQLGMTAGFIAFSVGVGGFAYALKEAFGTGPAAAAVVSAAATLGVAATPLGTPPGESMHFLAAGAGYLSLSAIPALAAASLPRRSRRIAVAVSVIAGASLVSSALVPDHWDGLFQRLGLTVVDVWLVVTALRLLKERGTSA